MDNQIIFKQDTEIMLRHTDAAGVIFYPRLFEISHHATECMWSEIGFPICDMMAGKYHHLPVVHAEGDYRMACRVGDKLTLEVSLHKLGQHSLGITCNFRDTDGNIRAVTRVDYVAVDPITRQVVALDNKFKAAIAGLGDQ